jgi:hypothetical protein
VGHAAAAGILAAGAVLAAAAVVGGERAGTARGTSTTPGVSTQDLQRVARTTVFFGHQSVGGNLLDAVPAVFAAHGIDAPPTARQRTGVADPAGSITHDLLGENEKPLGKIEDFDAILRSGMALQVDVAMMKLCYIDVRSDTDVDALFAAYRDTLASLQRDYPDLRVVAVTVPLTTEPGLRTRLTGLITRSDRFGPAENARRERFNALVRAEFGDRVFDLAAVESTAPDGSRVGGSHEGQDYYALYPGYASDLGHLDAEGSYRAAEAWLAAVARATRE